MTLITGLAGYPVDVINAILSGKNGHCSKQYND